MEEEVKIFSLWDRIGLVIAITLTPSHQLPGKYFRKLSFPYHFYSPQ